MSSVERVSVGFRNAIRDSVSRSRGPSTRPSSQRSSTPESSTPPPDRKFPFTIQGSSDDFGFMNSQTRSRTKESSKRPDDTRSIEFNREESGLEPPSAAHMHNLSQNQQTQSGQFPFLRIVVCWIIFISFVGATVIYFLELKRFNFFDCFFLAVGAATSSGLTTISLMDVSTATLVVLLLLALVGCSVFLSLIPVVVRMYYLKRHIPVELHTFDLKNFQRLPLWVVEYKSLQFIVRLVVGYMLFFYIGGCLLMLLVVLSSPEDIVGRAGHSSPLGYSLFTSVMAFTNAGLSPRPSFRGNMNPLILIIVDVLILAGNTMFPVLLRWIIIFLNKHSADDSNRKIYFRYLLINGRNHYAHIFTSQQTWLLVSLHCFFLAFQASCIRLLGSNVNNNQAVFMSINTRHAGFSAVNLDDQNAGILVLFLAMMFLAPTPFAVVLQTSDKEMKPLQKKRASLASMGASSVDVTSDHFESVALPPESPTFIHQVEEEENEEEREEREEIEFDGDVETTRSSSSVQLSEMRGSVLSRSIFRKRGLTKQNMETRMASRSLVINLAASQSMGGGASVVENTRNITGINPGSSTQQELIEQAEMDPHIDTRLVLLKKFGGGHLPLRVKVGYRLAALKRSLTALGQSSVQATGSRDLAVVWAVWFLILASERYTPEDADNSAIFNVVFEVVSAFGNVGLSLGSNKHYNVSFSADWHTFSQVLLVVVMIIGRTRELPSRVDGSLHLESSEAISASFLKPGAVVRRLHLSPTQPQEEAETGTETGTRADEEQPIEPLRDSTPDESLPPNISNL